MRRIVIIAMLCGAPATSPAILNAAESAALHSVLLDEKTLLALASEISGESAKRELEFLARQHRMRGSRQFGAAAAHIESALKTYGLADAHIERLPADGKIFYGTQRSRPAWNASFAELWEVDAAGNRVKRLASWDAAPITLAQDSESGEATAELVESGEVAGKFLLTASQPEVVADRGAAGIISYAQNQKTAWWGEDENLVRWGHLDTFAAKKAFAFMVSLKQAREFQRRLAAGETIRVNAVVKAGKEPGFYDIPTATIPGSEPAAGDIIFSCHLDHPRPGANDNASGCATILEVARSLQKLITEKRLPQPRRTMRFVWPAEIEGTMALLNGRPSIAQRITAAIHLDMVGGGPATKAIFHVTRGPASLPSFVNDVAENIGRFVNEQTAEYAGTGSAAFPLVAPEGGKEALQADLARFSMGSDHQVYTDSSFGIPAIYLNDWPDRYIHTNFDVPANIDPTKLKRAAFIAAASGWYLANFSSADVSRVREVVEANALRRRADLMGRRAPFHDWFDQEVRDSIERFNGARGSEYAYEALNLVNGQRSVQAIRDDLSAIYGAVPIEEVTEYLQALEVIGVISR
jgi:hypothetical protein